ncbi:MAG TPA: hypothetical protein VK869_12145 [Rubrobacteraceae bacterium]|nr:hypothetical protein [Rubrobacteraceae bacterium]
MRRAGPQTLLLVLVLVIPLVVAGATGVAFLLLRAGYGLLFGVLLPYGVSLLLIVAMAIVLGRAASGRSGGGRDGTRPRGSDGV